MVELIVQYLTFVVQNVSAWMYIIFDKSGGIVIYLGAIACFTSVRLLLRPFFDRRLANSGSDYAAPAEGRR